jgi:serine/threonine-protein kinase
VAVIEDDRLSGTLVADRYRVGRKLGEGGMGVVYLAVHEALHKEVALKVLLATGRIEREAIARFEREAIATANLKHPNIAEAMDFGQLPDGGLYLVMEYVQGTTLRRLLAEQGKLAPERALAILQQVGSALATAHARDVVHRDLKPENVIVTSAPESGGSRATDRVKVIDFGIAKLRSATFGGGGTGLTSAGTVFGTPEYMSPEQVMGQAVDARADQYSLGVLAFELLTGKPPYKADDRGQLMMMHVGAPVPSTREQTPGLSLDVDTVTRRMLAKLPDERFESVADAMEALAAALSAPGGATASRAAVAPSSAKTTGRLAPEPATATSQEATLPSRGNDAGVPSPTVRGRMALAIGVGALSLLLGVLLVVFFARSCGSPANSSPELTAGSGGPPAATTVPALVGAPAAPAAPSVGSGIGAERARPRAGIAPATVAAPAPLPARAPFAPLTKGKGKDKDKK